MVTVRPSKVTNNLRYTAEQVLRLADVEIGGARDWDIQINNDGFYQRVIAEGSLGFGESYMDGWWDVERLDELVYRLLRARLHEKLSKLEMLLPVVQAKVLDLQSKQHAYAAAEAHYDLGNDFFRSMLDARMVYTCGYWRETDDLDEAQVAKLDLVCRKIGLEPGMRVLDIGCGWGGFSKFAAEKHAVQVTGLTTSQEQAEYARQLCAGLPVDIRLRDYRELKAESFDRIVSLGMFEHVGHKNHRRYMKVANRCLKEDGLFLLQTIGDNATTARVDPWISKYIFPDGDLPSLAQITRAVEGLFIIEDLHNFGAYYDKTLMAWFANFERAWPLFKARYGERFFRMWKFYLLSCAGLFRARHIQLWQLVLARRGAVGGYARVC
jgi:cyclopropane-fatty-acyl-phospholipid synthase